MIRVAITALSCLLLLSHVWADDKEDAGKKEVAKLQGDWKLVGMEGVTLKFKDANYEFDFVGQKEKGKMKFNPTPKLAEVDVDITDGADSGKKQVGIYEIKADKIKFCFAKAGETKRPTKFEASGDGELILFEFEKVKK